MRQPYYERNCFSVYHAKLRDMQICIITCQAHKMIMEEKLTTPNYTRSDPLIDFLYSHSKNTLGFAKRKVNEQGKEIDGALRYFSSLPSDDELGELIRTALEDKETAKQNPTGRAALNFSDTKDTVSSVYQQTGNLYWPFVVWKSLKRPDVIILGTPYCSYYEISSRVLPLETPTKQLGKALRQLIYEVALQLRAAGLPEWQCVDNEGDWLNNSIQRTA